MKLYTADGVAQVQQEEYTGESEASTARTNVLEALAFTGNRKISNLARLGQSPLSPLPGMIQAPAASATQVSETECEKISLNDVTLDADEVRRVTKNEDRRCDFSDRGYTSVSDDAFHHVPCESIDMSGNNISHLPEDLFRLAPSLKRINLTGNQFCEAPVIKNAVVENIILDQNPVNSIPENYTDHLPKLHVMSLKDCKFLSEIDAKAVNCGCVVNPIQIYLDGTVSDLKLSCPEYVKVTAEEGDSVRVTCGNESHVTFESLNGTVWNEIVATTTETTSHIGTVWNEIVATTTVTILDLGTPYSTLHSESTPETPTDSRGVFYILGALLVAIVLAIIGLSILRKFKGSCKQQRNFESSSTPMITMDNGKLANGVHVAVDEELPEEGGG